jgi:phosphatidylglycerol:prolipoprotein diacylglycerol transferase
MVPYFQFTVFHLGPIPIQVWGLFVASGMMIGVFFTYHLWKKDNLKYEHVFDLATWIIVAALVFARIFHIVFYDPGYYLHNLSEVVKIWHGGMSSLGGFFGAMLAVTLFLRKRNISLSDFLPYADRGILGLWLGWGIGRIGCFLIHDHPGTLSHFMLAVKYPEGARHDLGFYESIAGFSIFIIFFVVYKMCPKIKAGFIFYSSIASYALIRFCTDFLRVVDARYMGLTPAQWGMIVVFGLTVYQLFVSVKNKKFSASK